jgi:putative hydrolase of the HAD superfamily
MIIPTHVRAIFFDAVGTLIHPEPAAPLVYAEVGHRHGSRLHPAQIAARFRTAFLREEEIDRAASWRSSEAREVERWRHIVADVLDDVSDPAACFETLFTHFGTPQAWRIDADARELVPALVKRGFVLGVASNYDHRLRSVAAGLPEFASLSHLIISAEVGWRKPAAEFFAALCAQTGLPAEQVLLIGDELQNDYEGARAAGLQALLLDPHDSTKVPKPRSMCRLRDLLV